MQMYNIFSDENNIALPQDKKPLSARPPPLRVVDGGVVLLKRGVILLSRRAILLSGGVILLSRIAILSSRRMILSCCGAILSIHSLYVLQ
jgi:hypothetical protein